MLGWLWQLVLWLVILGVVVILAAAVLVPRLAGATPYTVLTGSMQPKYPPGTLVVVKPAGLDDIAVGDVITYQLESGKETVVTHRVVGVTNRFDGTTELITQGDANDDPDPLPVAEVQVRGKLWYSVPVLGRLNSLLSGQQRQWAVYLVSAGLVGYAAFMFATALRDRRRGRRPRRPEPWTEEPAAPVPSVVEPARPVGSAAPRKHRRPPPALAAGVLLLVALVLVGTAARRRREEGRSS